MKPTWVAVAPVAVLVNACMPQVSTSSTVAEFPVDHRPNRGSDLTTVEGKLFLSDGCLRVEDRYSEPNSYIVYWPYGSTYRETPRGVEIWHKQKLQATTGDYVELVGSGFGKDSGKCKGAMWDAAGGIRVIQRP